MMMVTTQIVLDAEVYNAMEASLHALRQRVDELEQAECDRQHTESDLRQREELFRATFEQAAVGITFATLSGRYTHFNQLWCEIVGYSEADLLELTFQDITHPEDQDLELEHLEKLLTGKISQYSLEQRFIRQDRSMVWVHLTVSLMRSPSQSARYIIAVVQDISERKRMEEERGRMEEERLQAEAQLQQKARDLETTLKELQQTQCQLVQSEKMSSLGQLVAGIAHEINNPVNFIYGNLNHANDYIQDLLYLMQLYQQHCPTPQAVIQEAINGMDLDFLMEDLPKLLSSMRVGAERIREIIASLRNFSRLDEAEFKTVNLHDGIDSTLMILQNRLKAKSDHLGIQVIKHYGNLPRVQCYPGQLNQVFMNILCNAIDALEEVREIKERQPGIGKVSRPVSAMPTPEIHIHTEAPSPNRVRIRIRDNGCGISEAVQLRLFDPFFTTKPVGKGTGLGMSISYQIVTDRHQGSLECISHPGQGAEFIIEIPIRQARPT